MRQFGLFLNRFCSQRADREFPAWQGELWTWMPRGSAARRFAHFA